MLSFLVAEVGIMLSKAIDFPHLYISLLLYQNRHSARALRERADLQQGTPTPIIMTGFVRVWRVSMMIQITPQFNQLVLV